LSLAVPIVARGKFSGCITLLMTDSGRKFGPEDFGLARAMGWRTAAAIDTARRVVEQCKMIARLNQLHQQLHIPERERLVSQERERMAENSTTAWSRPLFSIGLTTDELLHKTTSEAAAPQQEAIDRVRSLAVRGAEELRAAIFALQAPEVIAERPPQDRLGTLLRAAFEAAARDTGRTEGYRPSEPIAAEIVEALCRSPRKRSPAWRGMRRLRPYLWD
jgi:hypothetical protein